MAQIGLRVRFHKRKTSCLEEHFYVYAGRKLISGEDRFYPPCEIGHEGQSVPKRGLLAAESDTKADLCQKVKDKIRLSYQHRLLLSICYHYTMDIFISHNSALEYWRRLSVMGPRPAVKVRNTKLQGRPPVARSMRTGLLSEMSQPLHVLVASDKDRRKIDGLHCHVWTGQILENSFFQIAPGLLVCSPEFLFLLMAKTLSLVRLIVLGFELCGTYRLGEAKDPSQGMREAKPLTSTVKLANYLEKAGSPRGIKNALQALKYIGDGSASPMETVLTMMLSLPPRLGGHGLPMPVLNHHFELPPELRQVAGVSGLRCDLTWLPQMIGLEYNSDIYHTAPDRIAWDALRSNILTGMGMTMLTATKQQITEQAQLQCLAEDLAKLMGRRLRHNEPEFSRRHTELRSQLLRKQSRG